MHFIWEKCSFGAQQRVLTEFWFIFKNYNNNHSFWFLNSLESSVDLCVDYSFWNASLGRCIPKNITDNSISERYYEYTPLCNREKFDCIEYDFWNDGFCPNSSNHSDCIRGGDDFFCNINMALKDHAMSTARWMPNWKIREHE